ncbi:MAG: alginate lyase family protein, partial [Balneolaceae bacterium]|nr:alginate lyase family protein [Balneolaceae bacterium]
ESDRNKFESWWREDILPHTRDVMIRKDNNWKDAGLLGVITAGAVFKDQEILDEAIWEAESYFEKRYDPSVHIKGYWKIRKSREHEDVVFLTREVTRADGRKGLSYTAYALTTMSQAFEIARYHGVNLWHRKTGQGVGMEELIETQFRWIILNEEFPWHNSPDRPGGRRNVFEIANNHYDNPLYESYLEDSRPIDGSQGDEYSTLNKGDIEPQSTDSSRHSTSIE